MVNNQQAWTAESWPEADEAPAVGTVEPPPAPHPQPRPAPAASSHSQPDSNFTNPTTFISVAAKKGDTILHVTSTRGMKVGQRLRVGTTIFEEVMVKSFGSINTVEPLRLDHAVDEMVVVIEPTHSVPHINLTFDGDDEQTEKIASNKSSPVEITRSTNKGKPTIPNRPTSQHEVATFHLNLVEAVLQVSNRADLKEKEFLDEMLLWNVDDPRLDDVPAKMIFMDRNLRPCILKICKSDTRLFEFIERKRIEYSLKNMIISSRKVFAMLYANLATDKQFLAVCTIKTLANLRWGDYGDKRAHEFLDDWLKTVSRIPGGLDVCHQKPML